MKLEYSLIFRRAAPLLVALAVSVPAWAKFGGLVKTKATFILRHPPAFYAPQRELRIEATSNDPDRVPVANHLREYLEQALTQQGFRLSPNASTVLQLTVVDASVLVAKQKRVERVSVRTGEHTVQDKKGKATVVEDCQDSDQALTYLASSGNVSIGLRVTDQNAQTLLASQQVVKTYQMASPIFGPPLCQGRVYDLDDRQLLNGDDILRLLVGQAVADLIPMIVGQDEPRTVLLAVDDELKPGNAAALAGDWQRALQTWQGAAVHGQPTEAARQYNLGVAYEVLASQAMKVWSLDTAAGNLDEAERRYRQALTLDPEEKYFRGTLERIQQERQVLEAQRSLVTR